MGVCKLCWRDLPKFTCGGVLLPASEQPNVCDDCEERERLEMECAEQEYLEEAP